MSKNKLAAIVAMLASYGGVQQAAAQAMPPPPAPAPKSYASTATAPAVYARHVGPVSVLEVRPDVSMLTVDGYNLAVIHGEDGVVVVDTGPEARANDVLAAIRSVSEAPIRYLVNTGAGKGSSGGNEILAKAGNAFSVGWSDANARSSVRFCAVISAVIAVDSASNFNGPGWRAEEEQNPTG